jgi:hypothetical protein
MKLSGIELRNFRSIGGEPVVLTPWRKCNILIGQNNSGKSNVIKAVQNISTIFTRERPPAYMDAQGALRDLDLHRRSPDNDFRFRLCFECDDPEDEELANLAATISYYFDFSLQVGQPIPAVTDHSFAHIEDFRQANKLMDHLVGRHFTQPVGADTIRKEFLSYGNTIWTRFPKIIPFAHIIPEFRQIQPGSEYMLNGANLIGLLNSYQHPEDGQDQDRDKFDRIERFVRRLLHLPEAVLLNFV